MKNYYESNKTTVANSVSFDFGDDIQHFPVEGLYLGTLTVPNIEMPALYDLSLNKGLCFLYKTEESRQSVNTCLERLAWRIAMTVPSNLCDIILYNGGNPGDAFNAHTRIDKYIFGDRREKIYFDDSVNDRRITH